MKGLYAKLFTIIISISGDITLQILHFHLGTHHRDPTINPWKSPKFQGKSKSMSKKSFTA